MFDFLKKKLGVFFGKKEEPKKKQKSSKKAAKKEKVKPAKKAQAKPLIQGKVKPKEKIAKEEIIKKKIEPEVEEYIEEEDKVEEKTEEKPEEEEDVVKEKEVEKKVEEKPKASFFEKAKGFFSGKKEEKAEEKTEEKSAVIVDKKPEAGVEEEEKEIEEDEVEEEKPKEEGFFSKLIKKISASKLTQEQFDELFMEFELTLLENNVALEAVDKIKENLSKNLVGKDIKKADAEKKVLEALKESILVLLTEPPNWIKQIKEKKGIYTIVFFGINGTGKTTTIAKIAHKLKKEGISSVLAAADTFRAASIEQLKVHGEKVGVPVISSSYGSDPASVAFDAKRYAEKNNIKVVLIDTAGRMYTKENLLKEMEKIMRVAQPDLKIFVGESITGNDAIDQARTFNETVGIDGIVLSKADIDEKAGTILSVSHVTGKPIYFLGTGQNYEDLEVFSKKTVLKNLGLEE